MFKSKMWKRNVKAIKVTASTLAIHIEPQNLNVVHFFFKIYDEKGMFDRPFFAKKCFDWLEADMDPMQPLITFFNSKMNRVANQLILKILSVQKLFILVQKFKHFLNNIFILGLAHF